MKPRNLSLDENIANVVDYPITDKALPIPVDGCVSANPGITDRNRGQIAASISRCH